MAPTFSASSDARRRACVGATGCASTIVCSAASCARRRGQRPRATVPPAACARRERGLAPRATACVPVELLASWPRAGRRARPAPPPGAPRVRSLRRLPARLGERFLGGHQLRVRERRVRLTPPANRASAVGGRARAPAPDRDRRGRASGAAGPSSSSASSASAVADARSSSPARAAQPPARPSARISASRVRLAALRGLRAPRLPPASSAPPPRLACRAARLLRGAVASSAASAAAARRRASPSAPRAGRLAPPVALQHERSGAARRACRAPAGASPGGPAGGPAASARR